MSVPTEKELNAMIRKIKSMNMFNGFKNIPYKFADTLSRIRKVFRWIPVLWRDRDFDESYLYIIMHEKLDSMADFYQSENTHLQSADRVAVEIVVIRDALYRLIEDDYYAEACDRVGYDDGISDLEGLDIEDVLERINTPRSPEKQALALKVYEVEEAMRMSDIKLVFSDTVSSQIRGWWD